jgi:hypothetical protein
MKERLGFARATPLRDGRASEEHSAQIRRLREEQRVRAGAAGNETFLVFGLLIAIAAGLIVLRAALWLPPAGL